VVIDISGYTKNEFIIVFKKPKRFRNSRIFLMSGNLEKEVAMVKGKVKLDITNRIGWTEIV